ncbi:MAG: hypothetical protein ABSB28_01800 [Candidatus Bathyarchaeia archaeon]
MKLLKVSLMVLLLLVSYSTLHAPIKNASASSKESIQISPDGNGIRIVVGDIELYFNASNGGEITEYFDLTVDPYRSRNLVNVKWAPYYNLLPLFTSLFYKPPNITLVLSTGGDRSAKLWVISNSSEYVILQSSSRIIGNAGEVAKDVHGDTIYVNSTWIVHDTGLVSVERTFLVPSYATVPSGWRWYPFYLTRTAGFDYNGTFFMFNTTYARASVVNQATYRDMFSLFSVLPKDAGHVSGVALPFSNTSIGGDGTHNILIAYKYDELTSVDEWRSDNYYSQSNNVVEGGAVHEFSKATNISTHTYHMIVNFTRQPIDEKRVQDFANYYADNPSIALPIECSVTANKDLYTPGDYYAFYGSGTSHYDLTRLTARLTVMNSSSRIVYRRDYGPANTPAEQTFNVTLLTGTAAPKPDNYTVSFQIFSPFGIVISSSSKAITVTTAL